MSQVLTSNCFANRLNRLAIVADNPEGMLTIAAPGASWNAPSYLVMVVADPSDDLSDEMVFRVYSWDLQSVHRVALDVIDGTGWNIHDLWPEAGDWDQ